MLDVVWWILIIGFFILSFIGLIFPIIPSVLMIWGGFLVYHFGMNNDTLSFYFWIPMVFLTILLLVADIIVNSHFVKRFGGSKWGERFAAIAVVIGSFIMPPFGIIIIPFITVFIVEFIQKKSIEKSFKAAFGSFLGFFGSTLAKVFVQAIMIIWFFFDVLINL
ncbi:hypothetical protein SAMN05421676_10496 [Salinibacillus kushneri]|uniref:DUF456 domain-containing protein n=1 Tax=Salinibacillus kushneri TaxID=237682 RepID=A0A1I0DNG3_9BACI|nr:DUF456 family protein [Salinibacillus kushneri]SET34056.1 hypothetical protein SAMN05421676_10496 [Salinibacillus kushneri]